MHNKSCKAKSINHANRPHKNKNRGQSLPLYPLLYCIISSSIQPEQLSQTAVNTREAHECEA